MQMNRHEVLDKVAAYFRTEQWQRLMKLIGEPLGGHIHVYVDTSIHPFSLEKLLFSYLKMRDLEPEVKIKHMPLHEAPQMGSVHNISPKNARSHFGLCWHYNRDVILTPRKSIWYGTDLAVFRDRDKEGSVEEFIKEEGYRFRTVGSTEEEEIIRYFDRSVQWQRAIGLMMNPKVEHFHVNVNTSIHPDKLTEFTLEALKLRGIQVNSARQSMVLMAPPPDYKKTRNYPKIMFLCIKPKSVWDIIWNFSPEVVLEPCSGEIQSWSGMEYKGQFDIAYKADIDEIMEECDFRTLSEEEIDQVLKMISNR